MKSLKRSIISLLLLSGAGIFLYHYALSDEAKDSLKGAVSALKNAYGTISELIEESTGSVVEENILPNREETLKQWEVLGY